MIDGRQQPIGQLESLLAQAGIANAAAEASLIWSAAVREASSDVESRAMEMARGRVRGTPLAYLTGLTRFMDVEIAVAPGALIPREETELLGRTAVSLLNAAGHAPRVIDMCCGSGNLACGIAAAVPAAQVWATDLTSEAVSIASANVQRLKLSNRVTVMQGDLFESLKGRSLEGTVDLIVCNPPYISSGRLTKDRAELLTHEPIEAFDGGPYGISFFQKVIKEAVPFLKPGGHLLFEIGAGQGKQVLLLLGRVNAYGNTRTVADPTGEPRVVVGERK